MDYIENAVILLLFLVRYLLRCDASKRFASDLSGLSVEDHWLEWDVLHLQVGEVYNLEKHNKKRDTICQDQLSCVDSKHLHRLLITYCLC